MAHPLKQVYTRQTQKPLLIRYAKRASGMEVLWIESGGSAPAYITFSLAPCDFLYFGFPDSFKHLYFFRCYITVYIFCHCFLWCFYLTSSLVLLFNLFSSHCFLTWFGPQYPAFIATVWFPYLFIYFCLVILYALINKNIYFITLFEYLLIIILSPLAYFSFGLY